MIDDGSDDRGTARARSLPVVLFVAIFVAIAIDLAGDVGEGVPFRHLLLELAVLVLSGAGALRLALELERERGRSRVLGRRLASADADAARWRREAETALAGLGAAIDEQFGRWALSGAEREVALLLLKGLSLREVAAVRGASERTVRHQALAVYRKSGVAGRAELSAFFLEDLLLPASPVADRGAAAETARKPGPRAGSGV